MNIFITGCSSGLGYGLSNHYLNEGHKVFGLSRSTNDVLNSHSAYHFLQLDLSGLNEIRGKVRDFLKNESGMDLVILNAGILNDVRDLKDTDIEEIKKVMDVNVWANKVLIDVLFEQLNSIDQLVAISSGAAVSGTRGWNAYSLSKSTLNMLIDLYSREHPQTHFCALAPGLIETGMQDYLNDLPEAYEKKFPMVKKLKEARGTDSMPKPDEAAVIVADAIRKVTEYESGSFLDVREL
jgi:NAD(P)-dependent dehydrogenase (short-subunit alcohol dehydrogenase family)